MDLSTLNKIAAKILVEEEAPEGSPFGRWAWSKYREGVPDDEETLLEKIIYKCLQRHFDDDRVGVLDVVARFLTDLVRKGLYKPVLHPPPYKTLYRGMEFTSRKALSNFLGTPKSELQDDGYINLEERKAFPPQNGYSTSWTFRKYITDDFSSTGSHGYAVTLIADVDENSDRFLAGPGGLYDVEGLSQYHLEKETVGLEPILVRRVEWRRF